MLTCSYPALPPLRVLLALLDYWPFPVLQSLERIRDIISWRFLYDNHRGYLGDRGPLGPPSLFRADAVVIFSTVTVAHVIEAEVFDFVTGPAIRAIRTVLSLAGICVFEAKQIRLTLLL